MLRVEDIDSPRVKAGAAEEALDDLRWLGLDWDEGPDKVGPSASYVQTERLGIYAVAFEQLKAAERIYPCTCSRSDVVAAASAPHVGQEGPIYPGTCRSRRAADADALEQTYCWRLRTTDSVRTIRDRVRGKVSLNVAQELGDFVIAKTDGTPSYQLAVVVDDHAMDISEVLRGDDLLPSAFRQLELYDFFGYEPPEFAHVPLVIGPDGRRLAKRHGDTRLSLIRQVGRGPERLLGLLAWSCGLRPTTNPVSACELLTNFSLANLPPEPFVFQPQMLQLLLSD